MPRIERRPGLHVARRLEEPRAIGRAGRIPTPLAGMLADSHNAAVREYGSDCGGFHAFDPQARLSAGVWDGVGGFPPGTVVTKLAWGRIDASLAQRLLDGDGVRAGTGEGEEGG